MQRFSTDWQAQYLLGCLYYDRMNYTSAVAAWQESIRLNDACAFAWRNLAQAQHDHLHLPDQARASLERALKLAPDNARIVYELLQLYKNLHLPVGQRISFLKSHESLVRQRDDCFLEMIILYIQEGEFARARELLLSKRFNIYEGGEGKLTRMHGWLYTLWGRQAQLQGDAATALERYKTALVYPDNYGEGRHYSAQEANIYYYMGLLFNQLGQAERAHDAWTRAANQPSQITDITYFAALSLQAMGQRERADAMFQKMIDAGEQLKNHAHRYGYFGVGMATPLPFELDVAPSNLAEANLLIALGRKGLGDAVGSRQAVDALTSLDPWNVRLNFFRQLGIIDDR